jgi:citrate lyase subunit beta/citryl-CoA lyase
MLQNLDVFEADAVIIDFEDSVVDYDKDAARILVSNFLNKYDFSNTEIFIRINDALSSNFLEDVKATKDLPIKGYVLPKALPSHVEELSKLTNKKIIPIIESPMGVLRMEEIAMQKNIEGILLGAEDLTKELNIKRTLQGTEILYTRSKLVLVCNAYNINSIDTPWVDKDNQEGLLEDTLNATNLGFTSKSSIHPNHVDVINTAFTPNELEILEAKRIVKKASETTKGAFSLDGKMVDLPIIEKAKKTLEKAKKYNLL